MAGFAEDVLPAINAGLNATSATLAFLGWRAVRARRIALHWRLMVGAVSASTIFLACYVVRMVLTGTHRFVGPPPLRLAYLVLLTSHMLLAILTVPLVGRVVYLAARGRIDAHRPLARLTLPIWLYVSVTGVIVYLMLYHVSEH